MLTVIKPSSKSNYFECLCVCGKTSTVRKDHLTTQKSCGCLQGKRPNKTPRQLAVELGETQYFTGKLCPKGHTANRLTYTGRCLVCVRHSSRDFYNNHFDKAVASTRKYRRNNKGKVNALQAKRRAKKLMATPRWSQLDEITKMYEGADYLTRLTGMQWHVDHVVPLINSTVCGLHVYNNLQYLPSHDNVVKGNHY
jgi:hypothetical protein